MSCNRQARQKPAPTPGAALRPVTRAGLRERARHLAPSGKGCSQNVPGGSPRRPPEASTLRWNTSAYPARDITPSWMRAPPESFRPTTGAPAWRAGSGGRQARVCARRVAKSGIGTGSHSRSRLRAGAGFLVTFAARRCRGRFFTPTHRHCTVHETADLGGVALAQRAAKHREVLRSTGGGPLSMPQQPRRQACQGSRPALRRPQERPQVRTALSWQTAANLRKGKHRTAIHGAAAGHHAVAWGGARGAGSAR